MNQFQKINSFCLAIAGLALWATVASASTQQADNLVAQTSHAYFLAFTDKGQASPSDSGPARGTISGTTGTVVRVSTTDAQTLTGSIEKLTHFVRSPQPAILIASPGASFCATAQKLVVTAGSVLVDLPKGTLLVTPGGSVYSKERALISVRMGPNILCVENCSIPNKCYFNLRGTEIELGPGREIMLEHGLPSYAMVPQDGVARRRTSARVDGTIIAILSDFEITSLLRSNPDFRNCVKVPVMQTEKALSDKLVKNAAVLALACAGRGQYTYAPTKPKVYRMNRDHGSTALASRSLTD